MSTVRELWTQSERRSPERTAVISGQERLTYLQLGREIRQLIAFFRDEWGVRPGEVIALLAPNCSEFIVSYFSIVLSGAVVQPLDGRLSSTELTSLLHDSEARYLVVHQSLWSKLESSVEGMSCLEGILGIGEIPGNGPRFEECIRQERSCGELAEVQPDDVAELMYTSGTTGEPKAVMRTHRNVRAAARQSIKGFGYCGSDIIAIVMPLSHSSALVSQMMPMLELSGTLVVLESFAPHALLETIRKERVTCLRAVPAMIRLLLSLPAFSADTLPSLRVLMNSSAAIDPELYMAVKKRFQRIQVMNSYGLTEASTCTILPDAMALIRPNSIGRPIEGVTMSVQDQDGHPLPEGELGEICVQGEHVFLGYRGKQEETVAALKEGWLRTGDLGYRDAEGYYYLQGRKTEVINCGGLKVLPQEVEECILELPEVAEVVVLPASHRVLGQVPKALVVLKALRDLDRKSIIRHCARNLPSHKVPFSVEIVRELPRNSVGKVIRRDVSREQHLSVENIRS